jgi:PilZ domain
MNMYFLPQYYNVVVSPEAEMKFMEQRRQERFEVPEAFVVGPNNIGQLVNISEGGLSFTNLDAVAFPEEWVLDIIIPASGFHLEQLPVELIWKKMDDHPSFLSMPMETVGVKLVDLHHSQEKRLSRLFSQLLC